MDVSMEVDQIGIHNLGINENSPDENLDEKVSDNIDNQAVSDAKRPKIGPRRSGRFRLRHSIEPSMIAEKSRVITRPRKLNLNSSLKAIESYYMDKTVKSSLSPALETIFEHPTNNVVMSNKKLRRCINFTESLGHKPDKSKEKKRKAKARKVMKTGFKRLGKKIGLELLINKLKGIDNDTDDEVK